MQIKDPEEVTSNICVATIHFVCHFFRIFNLRPSTRENAYEIIYSEGKIKYDRVKTASYELNFFTMTEQFHPTNQPTSFANGNS